MKDAFGVERVSKIRNPFKVLKPLGRGPGAQLAPGASVRRKPSAPAGNFINYDPGLRAQQARGAMKGSFR